MRTPLWGMGPPGNSADNEALGMGDNDRYATWDAAYVLGSLSAADRREFEAHMATCAGCREAVGDLSGVPALLSRLDREDVVAIDRLRGGPRGIGDSQDVSGLVAVAAGNGALASPP